MVKSFAVLFEEEDRFVKVVATIQWYIVLEAPRTDPQSWPAEPQDYTQNRCSQE
jgi:hypothetical protein